MRDETTREAPNYTNACIVMFGVNLAWILMAVWAIWGLLLAMLLGAVINHAMTRIEAWMLTRSEARRANPRSSARS